MTASGRALVAFLGATAVLTAAAPALGTDLLSAAASGFVVIVHADNPTTAVEREQLSRMFLKRAIMKWPDGLIAEPIDLATFEPARRAFSAGVHKKTVAAVRAFWQQQIFSGREVPPAEKRSEADVMAYVKEHPGAVGYVSANAELAAGVKPLAVVGIAP